MLMRAQMFQPVTREPGDTISFFGVSPTRDASLELDPHGKGESLSRRYVTVVLVFRKKTANCQRPRRDSISLGAATTLCQLHSADFDVKRYLNAPRKLARTLSISETPNSGKKTLVPVTISRNAFLQLQ